MPTYAGVPLLTATAEQAAHVATHLPSPYVHAGIWSRMAREVPVGSLVWPWSASRWAEARYLCSQAQLDRICETVYANGGYFDAPLRIEDAARAVETRMWMLTPHPLSGAEGENRLWLLPLVDERYWWWLRTTGDLTIPAGTSWQDVVSLLAGRLGETVIFESGSAYLGVAPAGLCGFEERLPPALDRVARSVGARLVRALDGRCYFERGEAALLAVKQNLALPASVAAGGPFRLDPYRYPDDLPTTLPGAVRVTFPVVSDGVPLRSTYGVEEALGGLGVAPQGRANDETATFGSTAAAAIYVGGVLTNQAELSSIARDWAASWYSYHLAGHDISYPGVLPWSPDGATEVEWRPGLTRARSYHEDVDDALDLDAPGASVVYDGVVVYFVDYTTINYDTVNINYNSSVTTNYTRNTTFNLSSSVNVTYVGAAGSSFSYSSNLTFNYLFGSTINLYGSLTHYSTSTITYNLGSSLNLYGSVVYYSTSTITFNSGSLLSLYGSLTYYSTSSSTYNSGSTVSFGSTIVFTSSSTSTYNSGSLVTYNSGSSQTYSSGSSQTYGSTIVFTSSSTVTYNSGSQFTHGGTVVFTSSSTITYNSGSSLTHSGTIVFTSSSTVTYNTSSTITYNSGSLVTYGSTIIYTSSSTVTYNSGSLVTFTSGSLVTNNATFTHTSTSTNTFNSGSLIVLVGTTVNLTSSQTWTITSGQLWTITGGSILLTSGGDKLKVNSTGIGFFGQTPVTQGSSPSTPTYLNSIGLTSGTPTWPSANLTGTIPAGQFPALTGDVTTTAGSLSSTIANGSVTLAKIANAGASSKLVGSGASGSGASYSEITLGTGLTMTGTTLSASGGGGGGTTSVNGQSSGSAITVSATSFTSTGISVSLPSAGTYLITAQVVGTMSGPSSTATIQARLYNSTDSAAVGLPARVVSAHSSDLTPVGGTAGLTAILTVAAAKTVRVDAFQSDTMGSPTCSVDVIIDYVQLA